jgi:phytoene dehydrogenase-like protein
MAESLGHHLEWLAALAETALGHQAQPLLQALLGSASALLRGSFTDERLQGPLAHWAAHSQQSPADPGTGAGALQLAGGHGSPAARPAGGSRATIEALVRCLEATGGTLHGGLPAERVEIRGGRAVAVYAGGERFEAARAVVSAVDARRLFLGLLDEGDVPPPLLEEVRRIHVGRGNVSELKVDAVLARMPAVPGPAGFERSFMLSANTISDVERSFAHIRLGELPERPPLMIAFPSALEPGWAPPGGSALWLSTFVPWRLRSGPWDRDGPRPGRRPRLADRRAGPRRQARAAGAPRHRPGRVGRPHRQPARQPQPHRDERRPVAGLPALAVAGRLPDADAGPIPDRRRHPPRWRRHRHPRPQRRRRGARDARHTPRAPAGRRLQEQFARVRDAARAVQALRDSP